MGPLQAGFGKICRTAPGGEEQHYCPHITPISGARFLVPKHGKDEGSGKVAAEAFWTWPCHASPGNASGRMRPRELDAAFAGARADTAAAAETPSQVLRTTLPSGGVAKRQAGPLSQGGTIAAKSKRYFTTAGESSNLPESGQLPRHTAMRAFHHKLYL